MLIIDEDNRPLGSVPTFRTREVERRPTTTVVRLFGRLAAYVPHRHRAYYSWGVVFSYRPAELLSVHQYRPSYLKVLLLGRYELGLILRDWLLGLRLGQPLVWVKRQEPLPVPAAA